MKEETKMHMPEGVDPVEDVEKRVPAQVIILVVVMLIVVSFATLFLLGDAVPNNPLSHGADESVQNQEGDTEATVDTQAVEQVAREKQVAEQAARELAVLKETLVGMPILVTDTPEKKFIRLSVKDKGIVSVGVDENTKNLRDGGALKLSDVMPGKELTIAAVRLSDDELYDYRAESVDFAPDVKKTTEERLEHIRTIGPVEAN